MYVHTVCDTLCAVCARASYRNVSKSNCLGHVFAQKEEEEQNKTKAHPTNVMCVRFRYISKERSEEDGNITVIQIVMRSEIYAISSPVCWCKNDELFSGSSKSYHIYMWQYSIHNTHVLVFVCMHALDAKEVSVDINFAIKNGLPERKCALVIW